MWHLESGDRDAAFWAQGYLHALTRADEALFARALTRSSLSLVPGATLAHTELDTFTSSWGFTRQLDAEAQSLPPEARGLAEAYAAGFSAQQAGIRVWPWQRPEFGRSPWIVQDSILLCRTWGFFSWWETRGELVFFLLELLHSGVSWERLADLLPELGEEPDRKPFETLQRPPPLSPQATGLLNRLRRWRPGLQVTGAQWGVSMVTDVTEPGLPYLEIRIEIPGDNWRGLSVPGMPGLLTGRNSTLAWHLSPSWGDVVDFHGERGDLSFRWAGGETLGNLKPGTLELMLGSMTKSGVGELKAFWQPGGSAALTVSATDAHGGAATWEAGPRWARNHPREAWLPSTLPAKLEAATRKTSVVQPLLAVQRWVEQQLALPGSGGPELETLLTSDAPLQASTLLPQLRFLLPETEEAAVLRTWSGYPADGLEAHLFQRLTGAVLGAFWSTAGVQPGLNSSAIHWLWPAIDRLLAAPHSSWLPSGERNRLLREAVARELAEEPEAGTSELALERTFSPRLLYRETLGSQLRLFATVVAVTCDFHGPALRVYHTDDETETPVYHDL
ncbi:MAG: penicillin acylase family protein [Spirochaetales bacterium]